MRLGTGTYNGSLQVNEPEVALPTWTNLLHWYSFDETSGNLLDLTGSDDGVVTGATQGGTGKIGGAYAFSGSDYVTLGTGETFGTGTFSITFWCRPTTGNPTGDIMGGATNSFKLRLWLNYRLRIMLAGAGGSEVVNAYNALTASVWNFVGISRTGSTFRMCINGSFEDETYSADFTAPMIYLGRSDYETGEYVGDLDELNIWSEALTDAELSAMYNSGSGKSYTG